MTGITPFGMFHTIVSMMAVAAGFLALIRHKEIGLDEPSGQIYYWFTVISCVTGLFIFHKGGFGPPHVLAIVTLVVLGIVWLAQRQAFGQLSRYVAVVGMTLTLFFHMIPGFTETSTRLPVGRPLATGPEDPNLQAAVGAAFVVYLVIAALQVWRIRASRRLAPVA